MSNLRRLLGPKKANRGGDQVVRSAPVADSGPIPALSLDGATPAMIRAWARVNGYQVAEDRPVPGHVVLAYARAHST